MSNVPGVVPHLKAFGIGVALAVLGLAAYIFWNSQTRAEALPVVTVYKTPTCGCCKEWVEHLEANGFEVQAKDLPDLRAVKQRLGVPERLASCHTAEVGGYTVEGHIPAEDVKRLLRERPDVAGLAVPGMPIGSPGMEVEGREPEPYAVTAFSRDGSTRIFARH